MTDFRSASFPSVSEKKEGKERIDRDREHTQVAFDLPVAGFSRAVREVRELNLPACNEVFLPTVTFKGLCR